MKRLQLPQLLASSRLPVEAVKTDRSDSYKSFDDDNGVRRPVKTSADHELAEMRGMTSRIFRNGF